MVSTWINSLNLWRDSWEWDFPIKKKIEKNYKAHISTNPLLKEIIEKEIYFFKKKNWVNLVNTWPRSWDQDNLIERKLKKKISKYNFEPLKLLAKVMRIRLPNTKQIKKKNTKPIFLPTHY